jgi:hypothetical protein
LRREFADRRHPLLGVSGAHGKRVQRRGDPRKGKLVMDGQGQMPRRGRIVVARSPQAATVRAAIAVISAAALRSNSSATA